MIGLIVLMPINHKFIKFEIKPDDLSKYDLLKTFYIKICYYNDNEQNKFTKREIF